MASSSYATHTDVLGNSGYLRDPGSANNSIIDTLCNVASRFVDDQCGQHFYDDGYYALPIDGQGSGFIDTPKPFFYSAGTIASCAQGATSLTYTASGLAPAAPQNGDSLTLDTASSRETVTINGAVTGTYPTYTVPCTATSKAHASGVLATTLQVEIAYFENQPLSQRIVTLDGDGVTPPTNFYVWPRWRPRVGAANQSVADNTNRRPWSAIDIASIPISNTTYLPTTIPGYATVRISAHWGWPVVPDLIKDFTCKYAVRLWQMRQQGERDAGGMNATGGASGTHMHFDPSDEALLLSSELKWVYI